MNFDPKWEETHKARVWGRWPCEAVMRFVMTHYGKLSMQERRRLTFLDLGCGAGATARFLAEEGFAGVGIDASQAAVDRCISMPQHGWRAPWLFARCGVENAQTEIGEPGDIDCVLDVCCLQHVDDATLEKALAVVRLALVSGGRFFMRHIGPGSGDWRDIERLSPAPIQWRTLGVLQKALDANGLMISACFTETVQRWARVNEHAIQINHWNIEGWKV